MSIRAWIKEHIAAESKVLGNQEISRRLAAVDDLYLNGRNMNGNQLMEVMTTSHFDAYFSDALSRRFYDAYRYRVGAWRDYTFMDSVPDFRDVDRLRMTEPGTLYRRREKAEAKATSVADSKISYGVEEYARQFDVSWQVILNDDLGAIREIPTRMLDAARRFEDQFVSNLYDNATTQAALVALGALYSGTGRLTPANLTTGITAMRTRTDAAGNRMDIESVWLVIPPESLITAETILESQQVSGNADNDANVLPRYIRGVRVDPYISTSGADRPWYLVADPAEVPTITVARLQTWPQPVVARKASNIQMVSGSVPGAFLMGSFETGDIEFLVQDILGGWDDATYVGVTDYRGIYYSSGTTA